MVHHVLSPYMDSLHGPVVHSAGIAASKAHRKSLLQVCDLGPGLGLRGQSGVRKLLGAQQPLLHVPQLLALLRALPLSSRQPVQSQTA